jgi:hypothetical protein
MGLSKSKPAPVLNSAGEVAKSIFEFDVETITGETVSMNTYKGKKAYIIVNVASQ